MNCDQFRDRPTTPFFFLAALRHRIVCPQCRVHEMRLARQHRIARHLKSPEPPAALRARVLAHLPEPLAPGKRVILKPVLSVGIGFAVLTGVWIALPRLVTPPVFATEVKSAIRRANTWHFVGWRMEGNKKVRWEIWGRRQPFFYREQIGGDVMIDNGKSRLRLLPPDRFQTQGYAISLPSQRLPMTGPVMGTEPSEQFIAGIGGDYLDHLYEKKRGANDVVFSSIHETGVTKDESLLTISRQTYLPQLYRLERAVRAILPSKRFADSYGSPRTAAELAMVYDVAIPGKVTTLSAPAHFQRIDAPDGLVLRPKVMERDTDGNIHVRIEHWLGGKRLVVGQVFPWFQTNVLLQCPPYTQPDEALYPTDESGRRYLPIAGPANVFDTDRTDLWLAPLEPIAPRSAVARTLTLPVMAKLRFDKGIPDPYVTAVWTQIPILSKTTTLFLPLPKSSVPLPFDNQPTSEGLQVPGPVMPLAFAEAMARYRYYRSGIGENRGVMPWSNREPSRKALFWLDRAITAGEKVPDAAPQLAGMRKDARKLREQIKGD